MMPTFITQLRLNRKPQQLELVHVASHAEIARSHAWRKFTPVIAGARILYGDDVEVILVTKNVSGPVQGQSGTIVIDEWTDQQPPQ